MTNIEEKKQVLIDAVLSEDTLFVEKDTPKSDLLRLGTHAHSVVVTTDDALRILLDIEKEIRRDDVAGVADVIDWLAEIRRAVIRLHN